MAATVVGLFSDPQKAKELVDSLGSYDIDRSFISVISGHPGARLGQRIWGDTRAAQGWEIGGASGAILGGLVGLIVGFALRSGMGGAGPVLSALVGIGLGAAAGSLIGMLIGWGMQPPEARDKAAERPTVISVHAPSPAKAEEIASVMRAHGSLNVMSAALPSEPRGHPGFPSRSVLDEP